MDELTPMHLTGLTRHLYQDATYQELVSLLQAQTAQTWSVIRSARPFVLATLAQDWPAPVIYLTSRGKRVHNVIEQLPVWLPDDQRLHRFAEPTPMFYDRLPWDSAVVRERIASLQALLFTPEDAPQPIIGASAEALLQRTMPVKQFRKRSSVLRVGEQHTVLDLIAQWVQLGYDSATMVTEPGTFSRRGGILDVFPIAHERPVRIEFFGDEIDTLRTFDPTTQRTVAPIEQLALVPAREALPDLMPAVARHLSDWFEDASESLRADYDALQGGQVFPHLEHYLPYTDANPISLLDYAPPDALIVIEDRDDFYATIDQLLAEAENNRENNIQTRQLPPDYPQPYVSKETILADLATMTTLDLSMTSASDQAPVFVPEDRFGGQLRPAATHIRARHNAGERVVVVTQQIDRLENIWYDQDASAVLPKLNTIDSALERAALVFVEGDLSAGWVLNSDQGTLRVLTDAEIFGWSRPEPRRRKTNRRGAHKLPESDYNDWHEGDYVVHVDYGIGQFQGLRSRTVEGNEREFLMISYANNGLLFVPIHQADRLTRYIGADDAPPKLNTMGKQDAWQKTKAKAKQNALQEARDLLDIYAKRVASSGHAYAADNAWQHELEASFPYVETDDQLRVIREVKQDMQQHMPMDRLVCGDVGYGKTEVAVRAAFKAVIDGKQVAVLVPTTVLADQHYQTFMRRMGQFPLKIASLSRFRTKAEQTATLKDLTAGKVDIVIGTHRLLSKDVDIPNLGLIVIDEEQRFGVKHKEHFKRLRANVDVLTLTATPIPRTLYLSLSGVRDISMLQTPPEDRLPVITHVGSFDAKLVRQAILREIDRGGQVFVIHNRVKSIENLREKLQAIVPEASIIIGHGQMSGRQLERVISEFSKGTYDMLLATSIIENGIDMPNVNTLIVDRADWFGMSQLYQIRGRVGRGATQAYAYFFHAGGRLTEEAKARLETLAEHTQLGAGLQISMRDLELRGSGDILSTKQTGHVANVGLQLYTQLLQQAVADLKGERETQTPTVSEERIIIDLPIAAYIPNDWIDEMALRLQLYRRIGNLRTLDEVEAMQSELIDRFGVLPRAVDGLLYQIRVKILASAINATAVIKPRDHFLIKVGWLMAVDRASLAYELGGEFDDVDVSRTAIELHARDDDELWQERLVDILRALKSGMPEQAGIGE
jgi:transcription-repair coupling factor (superfamily II helicase)